MQNRSYNNANGDMAGNLVWAGGEIGSLLLGRKEKEWGAKAAGIIAKKSVWDLPGSLPARKAAIKAIRTQKRWAFGFQKAAGIAGKTGAFSSASWKAAGANKIRGQLAKIALSRAGSATFAVMNLWTMAPLVAMATRAAVQGTRAVGRRAMRVNMGSQFFDNQGAYTERQRALRAITSSRMSARSAIGGEAELMHR